MKKNIRKFYVGAEHIGEQIVNGDNDAWTHKTLDEAIEHAKEILNDDDSRECAVVVEIKCIVRRAQTPLVVERLK
jgi:hypothetical protein